MRIILTIILTGLIWFTGAKPFLAEIEHFKWKTTGNRDFLEEAVRYDPHNAAYNFYLSQHHTMTRDLNKARFYLEKTLNHRNGDLTGWSAHYTKGALCYQMGSVWESQAALGMALRLNPEFEPARTLLEKVNKVIEGNDTIAVRFK